ncbi:SPOR domain-containing protein [Anianabacter salinae]|uniref:SPOR domain-containing protein n=1 Tax=Anianabacter salinae TaxID=2851023 RepID=UPI00225DFED3|nr:SPOR domain-containing protein [Anianabacter salinae]MBV0911896.1 SPOR domain-containing protein [Anianabacter salinae]
MAVTGGRGFVEDQGADHGHTLTSAVTWIGALLSLALVLGLGGWGYKLVSRDVAGIPVVRAEQGAMRMRPKSPGGELPVQQGLAVNAIAGTGAVAPPPNRIILAPRPLSLAAEDVPAADLALLAAANLAVPRAIQDTSAVMAPVTLDPAIPEGVPGLGVGDTANPERELALVPPSVPGIAASPIPRPRPSGDLVAAALVARVDRAVRGDAVDPASLAPGTQLVQLGAFDSPEVAEQEWARLATRFPDFLIDKSRTVQRATSGGKAFYRLRAVGFDALADARRFCAVLQDGGANCIPVVTR